MAEGFRRIRTRTLEIAYEVSGPAKGFPVILLHGFPDDPRCWDRVAPPLAQAGHRVFVPWLRGYGPTRFLAPETPRSGEQAALGSDLLAFMDALGLRRVALGGYDWGGRAACIVSALWPERVRCLVSMNGYNIQDIARSGTPANPLQEHRAWYQWYFQTERGRAGLVENRFDLCRLLWRLWSPNMQDDEQAYARTAASFDNPDFVPVVIHSYRHRHRHPATSGDPALEDVERRLALRPPIRVPSTVLHGEADGVDPPANSVGAAQHFMGPYARLVVEVAGHFLPREAPEPVVSALLDMMRSTPE